MTGGNHARRDLIKRTPGGRGAFPMVSNDSLERPYVHTIVILLARGHPLERELVRPLSPPLAESS